MSKRIVVLFSGGLDSATCLALARKDGHEVHALTVDYGQRHAREVGAACILAPMLGAASHRVVRADLDVVAPTARLLDASAELPQDRTPAEMARGVAPTYVPARNTVLLALGLALAESLGAGAIHLGCNADDVAGYPDCREPFLRAFETVAARGTADATVEVRAPLAMLSKGEVVRLARDLGVPVERTWSCYAGGSAPCGRCDACILRAGAGA